MKPELYDIFYQLLDLQESPYCFDPDIELIAKELGYDLTPEQIQFWQVIWQELKTFRTR